MVLGDDVVRRVGDHDGVGQRVDHQRQPVALLRRAARRARAASSSAARRAMTGLASSDQIARSSSSVVGDGTFEQHDAGRARPRAALGAGQHRRPLRREQHPAARCDGIRASRRAAIPRLRHRQRRPRVRATRSVRAERRVAANRRERQRADDERIRQIADRHRDRPSCSASNPIAATSDELFLRWVEPQHVDARGAT